MGYYLTAMVTDQGALTFHSFPKLPGELRIAIWILAAVSEPRDVAFQRSSREDGSDRTKGGGFFCSNSIPAILHACGESRFQATKIYSRAFTDWQQSRYTYFNFGIDALCVDFVDSRELLLECFEPADLNRVRKLILSTNNGFGRAEYWIKSLIGCIASMGSLECIVLVGDAESEDSLTAFVKELDAEVSGAFFKSWKYWMKRDTMLRPWASIMGGDIAIREDLCLGYAT